MLSLLERKIASLPHRLVLVAPPRQAVPPAFRDVTSDSQRWRALITEIQRLRARVYIDDGAVRPDELAAGGLHQTPEDERSWHLLMMNRDEQISSCVWYLEHENAESMDELRVKSCPLAGDPAWQTVLRQAVTLELYRARWERLRYAEIGGWAVSKESRCTAEGLMLALGAYSLGRFFGGALGLTTATVRHGSSTILRRLGGSRLQMGAVTVPRYFDPKYDCEMELLRFDSRTVNPKYDRIIDALRAQLAEVPVVSPSPAWAETSVA
ncbi:MAG: hypothetical protein IT184_09805 [Acidobacteria bacterium]|nr:hypothetical protein [Acidobacteriota bacterium]